MKILVTGAAGFVGFNFSERMVNPGHSEMVIDNLYTGGKKPNENKNRVCK
jgi:nucleoside-diphosphate-sugar epimerase